MSMLEQFSAALTGLGVARLKAAYGLRLDRRLPDRTYLERLSDTTAAALGSSRRAGGRDRRA